MEFEAKSYGDIAQRNLNSARIMVGTLPDDAAFNCQQAVEKILKELLIAKSKNTGISPKNLRVHGFRALLKEINEPDLDEELEFLLDLDDTYINTRYPGENYFTVSLNLAAYFLEGTERVFGKVLNLLEKENDEFEKTKFFE